MQNNSQEPMVSSSAIYQISGDMTVTMMYAEQALRDYNEDAKAGICPPLFFRNDKMVLVSPDDDGNLAIKEVDRGKLTLLLTQCGSWNGGIRATKGFGGYPPQDIVNVIYSAGYSTLNASKNLPPAVPILKGIHSGVLLDNEWNIVHAKGYNEVTKFYVVKDYDLKPVPDIVTEDDVKEGRDLLWNIFKEFLFEDAQLGSESVHYQNTIAALASAIIRPFWKGVLPIFLVDKSNSGTGGTLLQEIIIILAYGLPHEQIQRIGFPEKGAGSEYEKTLKSAILKGKEYGFIDNVPRGAEWAVDILLSQVTGCGNVSIRQLGKSTEISCGPSMYYLVNGINLKMTPIDVTRRIIPVRIISKKSLCELKGYFKRTKEELYRLAEEMHPQVIRAFSIFRKNWIQKGRPSPKTCSGNILEYQSWYNEICGMLYAAGYTHIFDNLEEIQTSDNDEEIHAADFIRAIQEIGESLGGTGSAFTPSQLLEIIYQEVANCKDSIGNFGFGSGFNNQTILPCLDDETAQAALKGTLTPKKLGSVLSGMKDMKLTGCDYVLRKKRASNGYQYYLEDVLKQETLTH